MALLALNNGVPFSGRQPLEFQGGNVSLPANYGNLGSYAKWRDHAEGWRSVWTPYAPDPTLLQFNVAGPAPWHQKSNQSVGAQQAQPANVTQPVSFTPAPESNNTVAKSKSSTVSAAGGNSAATRTLL